MAFANTLAYYNVAISMAANSCIVQAQEPILLNFFTVVIEHVLHKARVFSSFTLLLH
jgi:hypothetical protein